MTGSRAGGAAALTVVAVCLLVAAIVLPRPAGEPVLASPASSAQPLGRNGQAATRPAPAAPSAVDDGTSLVVLDFLPQVAEEVEVDPIAGHPDSDELRPFLGEPTAFGSPVPIAGGSVDGAVTRCGVVPLGTTRAIASALNGRLSSDQRVDPSAVESRTLLHWQAAEGYASLRIFAIAPGHRPTCAHAGDLT